MEELILSKIDELKDQMIQDIIQMVQIKSVESEASLDAPYGQGVKEALNQALMMSQRLGFKTKNVDNHMGYAYLGESDEYICAIGHLDVVPEGEGWKYPPYGGNIDQGMIYGRGVLDNKGPIMTCLYALKALKDLNIPMKHQVRIIFGCDEETGFEDLKYYLNHEKPPYLGFTPDCKYPVVYAERGRLGLRILAPLDKLDAFFEMVNTYFLNKKNNGETLGIDYKDDEFGMLEIRQYALHYEENQACFDFAISYPASVQAEDLIDKIKEKIHFDIKITGHYLPVYFPKESKLVKTLQKAYEYVTDLDGTPVTTTGGTYAKLMPNIVPFGPSFPGQKGIGHLPNEWMKIDDLITNAKIYALSLYYLNREEES